MNSFLTYLSNIKTFLRRKTEVRIIAIISFSLVAIVTLGVVSYSFLTGLLSEMMKEVEANQEVVLIKKIQQGFANVELANVSFKIYDDSTYFEHFSNEMQILKQDVDRLNQIEETVDLKELNIYKSLVDKKIALMDTLMKMKLMPNYNEYLVKIKHDIATIPAIDNKYKLLVGGKRVTQAYLTQSSRVFNRIKEVLDRVKQERKIAYDKINVKLVSLTDSLSIYASKIAEIKQSNAISKGDIANEKLAVIKWMIIVYCILAGSFLLALIYVIIKYLRRNAISKKILTRSKLRAENLAETKEAFLANMSHEIRTPLNAIVGFSNQLLKKNQHREQKEQLEIIQKSSGHLLHIVNEILDFSKLENGSMKLETTVFNPVNVAEEVQKMLQQTADEKKNQLLIEANPQLPIFFKGDPTRIKQIILNLTSNAIKFTQNGVITIILDSKLLPNNNANLIIEIKDTGIGIPKDKIKQIFKTFVQADADTTRKYGGTGLGLSICQRIVEMYGGTIHAESEIGKGATFTVNLPLLLGDKETENTFNQQVDNNKNNLNGIKVLIVDDQEFNRKLLRVVLNNWEVLCEELEDGVQVIEEVEKNHFDLILMDIRMPVLDGIKTTQKIRQHTNKKIAKTPIIGISAAITFEDKEEGLNAGMNDFITKPFTEEKLYDVLSQQLKVPEKSSRPKPKPEKFSLDFSELMDISSGDNSIVISLLETYIDSTSKGIDLLEKEFQNQDKTAIREQAHKIASPNRHIGAVELYQRIKQLENLALNDASWEQIKTSISAIVERFSKVKVKVEEQLMELKSDKIK